MKLVKNVDDYLIKIGYEKIIINQYLVNYVKNKKCISIDETHGGYKLLGKGHLKQIYYALNNLDKMMEYTIKDYRSYKLKEILK